MSATAGISVNGNLVSVALFLQHVDICFHVVSDLISVRLEVFWHVDLRLLVLTASCFLEFDNALHYAIKLGGRCGQRKLSC